MGSFLIEAPDAAVLRAKPALIPPLGLRHQTLRAAASVVASNGANAAAVAGPTAPPLPEIMPPPAPRALEFVAALLCRRVDPGGGAVFATISGDDPRLAAMPVAPPPHEGALPV